MHLYAVFSAFVFVLAPIVLQGATNITTVPGNYTWSSALQSTVPGFLALDFTATNGPVVSEAPSLMIALSEQSTTLPAYTVTLSYTKATDAYALFATKRGGSTPLQTRTITATDQPAIRAYLDAWRNGSPQSFSLLYNEGALLLLCQNVPLWSWHDDSPIPQVCRASFSSSPAPQTCNVITCSSTLPAIVSANTSLRIPVSAAPTIITFKSTALPSSINSDLFAFASDQEATYSLIFDTTNGIHTQLTHKVPGTAQSAIPTTSGSYDATSTLMPAALQTYFIAIAPRNGETLIAFGLIADNASPQTLLSWCNQKSSNESIQFCALRANVACSDPKVMRLSFDIPSLTSPLGLTKNGDTYTAVGLNQNAAYQRSETTWQEAFPFPAADNALIECDLTLTDEGKVAQNGAVILFGTQAQGQAMYGLVMEPAAEANALYGSSATRARFRLISMAGGVSTTLGDPVTIDSHTLKGTYQIAYEASGTGNATVTISQGSGSAKRMLAALPINGATSGIRFATLSAQRAAVLYRSITITTPTKEATANTSTTTAATTAITQAAAADPFDSITDSFDTLTRNKAKDSAFALAFNWNHSALQQVVDQTNGFSLEANLQFRETASERTIVIGLAPNSIDQSKCYHFSIGGQQVDAAFAGATQLIILSLNQDGLICMRSLPSPQGTSSPIVSQKRIAQTFKGASHTFWLTYRKTAETQSVAIGIDSAVGENPLFDWSDTRTSSTADYAKIGLSSWWQTDVAYRSIVFKSLESTAAQPTVAQTATTTTPNTLTRTPDATDPYGWNLKYDWSLGKKEQNTAGTFDASYGGSISALVQVVAPDKDQKATFMIGFTSDPAAPQKIQENGQPAFPGALYNIQLQAKNDNGYISLRRPTTSTSSPFEAATFATPLTTLLTKESGATTYPIKKVWARYTPSTGQRLFEAGLVAADDTRAIADITEVLWTWTETGIANDQAPLLYAAISSWDTACSISNITVTKAKASTTTTPAQTVQTATGTLSASGLPIESQWTLSAFAIKPGTAHTLTISGTDADQVVIAFSPNAPASTGTLCTALITKTGITLRDAQGKTVGTSAQGSISSTSASYIIRANTSTISISLKGSTAATETPLVSWTNDVLKTATDCWYAAYGFSETAIASYEGGIISTTTGTIGNAAVAPVIRSTRPGSERTPLTTRAAASHATVLSSAELAQQQYRVNRATTALTAPLR